MTQATDLGPFVIRHTLTAGLDFSGALPPAKAENTVNNLVATYDQRNAGGLFSFSDLRFYELRRMQFDFKEATSWKITLLHPHFDSGAAFTELANAADYAGNKHRIDFDGIILSPGEQISVTTTGMATGTPYCEVTVIPRLFGSDGTY